MQETQSLLNFMEGIMKASKANTHQTNEVLFQKLGTTWYVFSEVEGELVYSALPEGMSPHTTKLELFEVVEDHMAKVAKHNRRKAEVAA
jgi:hypothetical protein